MRHRYQADRTWRWLVVATIVLHILVSYLSDYLPGQNIATITNKYDSLFTPADYAFSIWAVIYTSFIIYGIYQLLPSQRDALLFDHLAKPFVVINVLGILWVVVYRMDFILLSTVVIAAMFLISVMLYIKVRNVVLRHDYTNWISIPFSLFSGWLSVATMANISILFISQGWQGSSAIQLVVAIGMILAAGMLGIFISYRCADFVFPAVVSWACVAIFVARGVDYYPLGAVALLSASLPIVWFLLTVIKRIAYRHRIESNKFSFDDTVRLKLNGQNKLLFGRL
jgi:hypothetical protein